jgi:hypothetical protein
VVVAAPYHHLLLLLLVLLLLYHLLVSSLRLGGRLNPECICTSCWGGSRRHLFLEMRCQ